MKRLLPVTAAAALAICCAAAAPSAAIAVRPTATQATTATQAQANAGRDTTTATTAWSHGRFGMNAAGVVSRSDIFLGQPNESPQRYMPLGNGSLAASVWAANGFTAQLNRSDTLPDRLSPGRVTIPGLAKMTTAADFTGRLDLYNGVLTESGGGMMMKAWVLASTDGLSWSTSPAPTRTPCRRPA